ncbi:MAG TPA: hypothetical protein VJA21_08610 [Verrucomicrobiae bacterium]
MRTLAEDARALMAATADVAVHEHRYSQHEEVVDEITAWWQKALGTKAVLGQASNRPPPGPRPPVPKLQ